MALTATWSRISAPDSFPPVSSHTLSVINNVLYLFSGETQPRVPIPANTHILPFDSGYPVTLTAEDSNAPPPRVGAASAVLNEKIYLFGGRGGTAMNALDESGRVWVFDPVARKWSFLDPVDGDIPPARSYHCAAATDGVLFVHAGCPASGRLADLWGFHVGERRWRKLEDAPGDGRGGTSIAAANGKVWRWGGFNGKNELGDGVDVYDIASNSWNTLPAASPQPEPRSVSNLTPLIHPKSKKLYLIVLFGERDPSSLGHAGAGNFWEDVWAFDVEEGSWLEVNVEGEKPVPRGWISVAQSDGGVLLYGGLEEGNRRLGDAWVLEF
ncbi:hypothetical protein RUND412_007917 [Rhizina undulata]